MHFWRYTPEEFGWIDENMSAIRRSFLPGQLEPVMEACGVEGVLAVQARQSLEETDWLLELASKHDFIRGVVGWVPLVVREIRDILGRYAARSRLTGVRHVLQSEGDERYMLREDFNRGIDALAEFGWAYDILIFEHHLPQTIEFVDRHPEQVFVLDHIAKPRIRDRSLSAWRTEIRALSERPRVYCKLSGMITEAAYASWSREELRPYFDAVLEAFGPNRLMFGSDWPVCLVAAQYRTWLEVVAAQIATLSDTERAAIMGRTAMAAYRLSSPEGG